MTTKNNIYARGLPGRLRSSLPRRIIFCAGVLHGFVEMIQCDSVEGEFPLLLALSPVTSKLGGSFTPDHRRKAVLGSRVPLFRIPLTERDSKSGTPSEEFSNGKYSIIRALRELCGFLISA